MIVFATLLALVILLPPLISAMGFAHTALRAYVVALAGGYGLGKNANAAVAKRPVAKRTQREEPAWDFYLRGQAWRDILHAHGAGLRATREAIAKRAKDIHAKHFADLSGQKWIGAFQYFGMALGLVLAFCALLAAGVGAGVLLAVLLALSYVALYLLRLVDAAMLRIRGITMTCKTCGHRVTEVLYGCPGCKTLHGDVRPGRHGMTHRRCNCGKAFPSMMVLMWFVKPEDKPTLWCPGHRSGEEPHELSGHTGETGEIVLPVFGAPSAGKTQLITVLIIAVEAMVTRSGGEFSYADAQSRKEADKARSTLIATSRTEKTAPARQSGVAPPACSVLVSPRRGARKLVHVFDAAGEIFSKPKEIQELEYFRNARTYIFVIDPTSIKPVWEEFDAAEQQELDSRRARQEPHVTFSETVTTMTNMGVDLGRIRLAVAVSKADLIKRLLTDVDTGDSDAIKAWLEGLGQGNIVRRMGSTFKEVTFFLTSALTDDHHDAHPSVETFTEQTLADEGLRL
ncbi:TRAFAC clade GTPase domain-containing protein [Lentzea flava]|uniref:Double-GTPase 2 domain-containing protein n=1 Tax=Lentzea flava TaxID=103732 RepID=A0ABQ2UZ07_9PSEU|nr:hypothetical protein [Lentzea flava]MCP2202452.1 hypothetical protein [Lentzea flava]GGU59172.1 hypothetical protein GCM10010178_59260 [Lentzea flava]